MITIKEITAGFVFFLLTQNLWAQEIVQLPWQQRDRKDMRPLDYEYQREADVFWSKNIWRIIDTRQKMNKPFAYPSKPLIQIIQEAALRGEIKVYDPAVESADQFKRVMDIAEVAHIGVKRDTVIQVNVLNPDKEDTVVVNNELAYYRITKYRVKEVWFFDTKTSSMQVRILGIAPVMEDYDDKGNYRGDMTMYWVYFPDLRNILARKCSILKMIGNTLAGTTCLPCGYLKATFIRRVMYTTETFRSMPPVPMRSWKATG